MRIFRKRTKWRSVAAIVAAYAIVLHAFLGAIVLSQSATAAESPFIICQAAGGDAVHDSGQAPAKPLSCVLLCATHAAGTVPQLSPEIALSVTQSTPLVFLPAAVIVRSIERSPRLAQAPPVNV